MRFDPREDGLFVGPLGPDTPLRPGDRARAVQDALVDGDPRVVPLDDGVLVQPALLREPRLGSVGLQRLTDRLEVRHDRLLVSDAYRWIVTVGGAPAVRRGPWLVEPYHALLDDDQQAVLALSEAVGSAPDRSARLRLVADLQRIADRRPDVVLSPALRERVHVGEQIRVSLEPDADGVRPVPHLLDAHDHTVLPMAPDELARVALKGLGAEQSLKLDGGWLITTPGSARNLAIAVAAHHAAPEDQRRFVQNPTAFLPDDDAFDRDHYAERVIGAGALERVAPAGTAEERDWYGAEVDLVVLDADGASVAIPGARVPALHRALERAVSEGEPAIAFDGRKIPATEPLLRAVRRVLGGARPTRPARDAQQPVVLLIADNGISLDWAPSPASARAVGSFVPPPTLVALQPHQQVSLRTLQELWRSGERGALLCDDMGLGKTLQALTFAAWVAAQPRPRETDVPAAIVAPPALLEGWLRELEVRLPPEIFPTVLWGPADLPVGATSRRVVPLHDLVLDGRGQAVTLQHARMDRAALAAAAPDLLLVSYDQVRRLQFALGQLRIGALVADEAHWCKDPNSLRSRALRALDADFALALTGTPIENGWRDLWTLCDFAAPGRLGTLRDFAAAYPPTGDVHQLGAQLADTLRAVLVRRTRRDVLDQLPPCTLTRDVAEMPEDQRLAYDAERVRHHTEGGSPLVLLQRLAQVSLHPRQRAELPDAAAADAWAAESARTAGLWRALARFRDEGAAVLVFVRSVALQETLARAIRLAFDLDAVGVLNGTVPMGRRTTLVDEMAAGRGFRVLLVSPEVGGVGWNLQFATRAVLLERTWNPAKEAQMIARVHRLGQTEPVEIVTPLAVLPDRRSFDAVLDALLEDKRALSESVLAPAEVSDDEVQARFRELMGGEVPRPAAPPAPAAPADPAAWAAVWDLVDGALRPLVAEARDAGRPAPEVGYDFQHGRRVVASVELAWPAARIAVVLPGQVDDAARAVFVAAGWAVYEAPVPLSALDEAWAQASTSAAG